MTSLLKKEYFCATDNKVNEALDLLRNSNLAEEYKDFFIQSVLNHRHILLGLMDGTLNIKDLRNELRRLAKENNVNVPQKKKEEQTEDSLTKTSPGESSKNDENPEQDNTSKSDESLEQDNTSKNENSNSVGTIKPKKNDEGKGKKGKNPKKGKRGHKKFNKMDEKKHIFDPGFVETDYCPCCGEEGKLYSLTPSVGVFFTGSSPILPQAHVTEKARCSACGVSLAAQLPIEVENSIGRFLPEAVAQFALTRFSLGFPHHRMEYLNNLYGLSIPDSNQWSTIETAAIEMELLLTCLTLNAANAKWIGIDDASALVIELKKEIEDEMQQAKIKKESRTGIEATIDKKDFRTGVQSSIFVAKTYSGHEIVLYMTGRNHQGENKAALLELRTNPEPVILMTDAAKKALMKIISHNNVEILETNCLEHFRQRLEEIRKNYPKEAKYILDEISKVYKYDAHCKKEFFNDLERLDYHQKNSKQVMDKLKGFIEKELNENPRAEPNGEYANKVLNYAKKHWERLTGFLTIPGAELDNNPTERKVKTVARYLDNSKKYLTEHGASIGDFYMSLIETCKLNNINPLEYLTFCITYRKYIPDDPELFLPWNFLETKKEFEEKLKHRPRYRIVSQRGAYIPKKQDLYAQQ